MAVLNFQRADFWLLERVVPLPGTGCGREVSSLKAFPSAICQYDTVIADRFSLKGIIRLTIGQPGSFQRPFDNYLIRSTGNSSMQQRILIGTGLFQLLEQLKLLFNQCAFCLAGNMGSSRTTSGLNPS